MFPYGTISKEDATFLKHTGSSPATLYGLPKIHKKDVPLRPIMAAYNTAPFKLSKFLVNILSEFSTNEFTVKNSYEFTKTLNQAKLPNNFFMCSFDITSLFTNIPLTETVNVCINLIFKDLDSFLNMTKTLFKSLLEICVKDVPFIFNKELYKQTDGVAMGSPLGPTFANLF